MFTNAPSPEIFRCAERRRRDALLGNADRRRGSLSRNPSAR